MSIFNRENSFFSFQRSANLGKVARDGGVKLLETLLVKFFSAALSAV